MKPGADSEPVGALTAEALSPLALSLDFGAVSRALLEDLSLRPGSYGDKSSEKVRAHVWP